MRTNISVERYMEDTGRAGYGMLALIEGMLVATDRRIIFLDHKPGFTTYDEINYGVITAATQSSARHMYAVTLHTRIKDYSLRFANKQCVDNFVRYLRGNGWSVTPKVR